MPHKFQDSLTIFFFPHQDDEFACFESIFLSVQSGEKPLVVFCTTTQKISNKRNRESRKVLKTLGISDEQILFLGDTGRIHDGIAFEKSEILHTHICRIIERTINVRKIFIPAFEGGHQDHDLLHGVIRLIVQNLACVMLFETPLYRAKNTGLLFFSICKPEEIKTGEGVIHIKIPARRRLLYLALCLNYISQWRTWIAFWPMLLMHYCIYRGEFVIKVRHSELDYLYNRPNKGLILYEIRKKCSFDKIASALFKLSTKESRRTSK